MDTFELAEGHQTDLFTAENKTRVERQQHAPMFVIIGNPPYNMGQVNENDNNKNRKYETIDKKIANTYATDSTATLRNKLYDPYVKAIRWASDRIGNNGVVAFVTNHRFLDGIAFDGMRKHLADDFSAIYILDLGGNVGKNPSLSGTTHNVFGIKVGVSINILIRRCDSTNSQAEIYYAQVDEFWRKRTNIIFLIQSIIVEILNGTGSPPIIETHGLLKESDPNLRHSSRLVQKTQGLPSAKMERRFSHSIPTVSLQAEITWHTRSIAQD